MFHFQNLISINLFKLPAGVYITPPPPDLQQLIDKVAYQVVSSTSESFERHLKEGGNSIYDFLYPSNQYNAYYRVRKGMFKKDENIPQKVVLIIETYLELEKFDAHNYIFFS